MGINKGGMLEPVNDHLAAEYDQEGTKHFACPPRKKSECFGYDASLEWQPSGVGAKT
jgi:hypothetical protein